MTDIAVVAAIIPTILFSLAIVFEKKISSIAGHYTTSLFVVGVGIIPILLFYLYSNGPMDQNSILFSIASGVFFTLGMLLYYRALETEQIANTGATGLVQPAILVIFSILVLGESLKLSQAIGGIIIALGVFLVVTNQKFKINKNLVPALLANISWALYWVFASYAILESNQVGGPLLISRITGMAVALIAYKLLLKKPLLSKEAKPKLNYLIALGVLAGVLDGVGNAVFGYIVNLDLLSLASIFTTILPLLVAGFGYLIYKERLTKFQGIGIGVAIIGSLIIALF